MTPSTEIINVKLLILFNKREDLLCRDHDFGFTLLPRFVRYDYFPCNSKNRNVTFIYSQSENKEGKKKGYQLLDLI